MRNSITRVRRLFTVTIISLCLASMLCLLGVLYTASIIEFSPQTSPQELHSMTANYPAVSDYLEQQKKSEAHFVTIANLVKSSHQELLGRTAIIATLPLLIAAAVLGYLLARYLLRPVSEAYESQERFLQDAAHELRNPLATMSAVIQQMEQSKPSPEMAKRLGILERQANQLIRINEDLLFLERTHQQAPQLINVSELLHDVAETLQPLAAQRNIKLAVQGKDVQLAVHADDFICLARNLLENAIKYSKPSGKATVRARLDTQTKAVIFSVTDSGIGIPEAELAHIGERFYRATNTTREEGSGLGFAIVQKIAADYDAAVDVKSTIGRGTTGTVTFKS